MARRKDQSAPSTEEPQQPSVEGRKGKRGHDEHGNVRPADGRWGLHEPKDESKHVRTSTEEQQ